MSISSGGPTRHITEVPGKPPQSAQGRRVRGEMQVVVTVNDQMPLSSDKSMPEQRIPEMGLPGFWYRVKLMLSKNGSTPKVPKPSKTEQELWDHQEKAQQDAIDAANRHSIRHSSKEELRQLCDEVPSFTVVFVGIKGASATTTTMANCTSLFADTTRTTVYAADLNPASGTAGIRLGKNWDQTISLRELGNILEDNENQPDGKKLTKKMVNAMLRPTKYGVRVLSADDYILQTTEQFGTRIEKILIVLQENCDYLSLDTANDISTPASIAALRAADVIVFTANVASIETLFKLYDSMEKVRQLGMVEKVAHSVVAISNIPEGKNLEDYIKYLNRVSISDEVILRIRPEQFQGPFMGVPHERFMLSNIGVELELYEWETTQAYMNLVIAIAQQALQAKQGISDNVTDIRP